MSSDSMILFNNGLDYSLPVPTSVVVGRTKKRSYFQNRGYSSQQTMTCNFNTGSDYIDVDNSQLVIKVKVLSTNPNDFDVNFGSGSAMNIIDNMRCFHRSGTQYSSVQKLNVYRTVEDHNCESANWFDSVGRLMGYDLPASSIIPSNAESTFIIPLKKVNNLFNPHNGVKLMPAAMAAGLKLELDGASLGNVFKSTGAVGVDAPTDYEITDIYFDLECVTLMDSAQASINTNAQKRSLEWLFSDVYTSRNSSPSNSTMINVDVNKSVSYAEKVFSVIQSNASQNDIDSDGYSTPYKFGSWWYQLGNQQLPSNQKISNGGVAYSNNLSAWQKYKGKCGERGETKMTFNEFANKFGAYVASLELDTDLNLSGQPITSSRVLRLEIALDSPLVADSTTCVFMTYLTSIRSTLSSSKVDI